MRWDRVWHRARHRGTQFFEVLGAPFRTVDNAYVRARLSRQPASAALFALFQGMSRPEQLHGIHVCRVLERQGFEDPDLLTAALLHDVGKQRAPPRLWERVAVVLIERFAPRLTERWRNMPAVPAELRGLRRGFGVRYHHAEWGAAFAAEAQASSRIISLIRQHHCDDISPGADPELVALQAADDG